MVGGPAEPMRRLDGVARHPLTLVQHDSDSELPCRATLDPELPESPGIVPLPVGDHSRCSAAACQQNGQQQRADCRGEGRCVSDVAHIEAPGAKVPGLHQCFPVSFHPEAPAKKLPAKQKNRPSP